MTIEETLAKLSDLLDGHDPHLFSRPVGDKPGTYYYQLHVAPETTLDQAQALMSQGLFDETRRLLAAELSHAGPPLRLQHLGQAKQIAGAQTFDLATYVSNLHYLVAQTWIAERKWPEARANILKALTASPKHDQPRDLLVTVYCETEEYEHAISHLAQRVKRAPDQCVKLYALALQFHVRKLLKEAASAYQTVSDLDEDGIFHDLATGQIRQLSSSQDPPDLQRLALQTQSAAHDIDKGNATHGLNKLLAFLTWAPDRGQLWFLVGYVYQQLLGSRQFETNGETVVRVQDQSDSARSFTKRAAQAYQAATTYCPELAQAHHQLANCLMAIQRSDEAIAPARMAVQLEPENTHFLGTLGDVLLENDNLVEAEKSIRQALAANPRDWLTCLSLAKCLMRLGKYDEAQSHSDMATAIRSKSGNPSGDVNEP